MANIQAGNVQDGFTWREADRGNPSPRVSYDDDGIRMLRDIEVVPGTMAANYAAAKLFKGYPTFKTVYTNDGAPYATYISRSLPDIQTWTDFPDSVFVTGIQNQQGTPPGVRTAGVAPWNETLLVNEYAESLMLVEYRPTNHEVAEDSACLQTIIPDGDLLLNWYARNKGLPNIPDEGLMLRYCSRSWAYASHLISIPQGFTCFLPDQVGEFGAGLLPLPNKGGYPFREGMIELTYVWKDIPITAVPNKAIQKCLNTMNGAFVNAGNFADPLNYFDPLYWNVPTYCALFLGGKPHVKRLITGQVGVDLEYKFLYAPHVILSGPQIGKPGGWARGLTALNPVPPSTQPVDYRILAMFWNNVANQQQGVGGTAIGISDFSTLFRPDQP